MIRMLFQICILLNPSFWVLPTHGSSHILLEEEINLHMNYLRQAEGPKDPAILEKTIQRIHFNLQWEEDLALTKVLHEKIGALLLEIYYLHPNANQLFEGFINSLIPNQIKDSFLPLVIFHMAAYKILEDERFFLLSQSDLVNNLKNYPLILLKQNNINNSAASDRVLEKL